MHHGKQNFFAQKLKSLGLSLVDIDTCCNLSKGTAKSYGAGKTIDPHTQELIDDFLAKASNEQDELVIAATDAVFDNINNDVKTFYFLPVFATSKTYVASGYLREYGSFTQYRADIKAIYDRISVIETSIYLFTPLSVKYEDSDIYPALDSSINKIIIDPLRFKRALHHQTKGDRARVLKDKKMQRYASMLRDRVFEELEYYHTKSQPLPKHVWLPLYLSEIEFNKRKSCDLTMDEYNQIVENVLDTVRPLYPTIQFNACAKNTSEGQAVEPQHLTIDLLEVISDGSV